MGGRYMCPYTPDMVCVDVFSDKNVIAGDCENCPYFNNGKRWY